jgi:hypothetical protein
VSGSFLGTGTCIFHGSIQLIVKFKSDHDPDPDWLPGSGSASVYAMCGMKSWIRIRIDMKPMQMHNTVKKASPTKISSKTLLFRQLELEGGVQLLLSLHVDAHGGRRRHQVLHILVWLL